MAVEEFTEKWQSFALNDEEYCKGKMYSIVLSILVGKDSIPIKLELKGNLPILTNNRLRDLDVKILCKALEWCPKLVSVLDLCYNPLSNGSTAYLVHYLKDPACSLQTLDLSYTDIVAEGIETLTDALQFNNSITNLQLNGCKMGHKGGISVATMLQVNSTIQQLGLAHCDLNTDSIIAMATVLLGNKALRNVDLSRPLLQSLQEETTIHLSKMLKVNVTLQELHLTKHAMTDGGVEWICRALRENPTLTLLNVSSNHLSRDGAQHFAGLLSMNPPLQELDISKNRIEDEGLQWLSNALASNTHLCRLNVCHNSVEDSGLCHLAAALDTNSSLKQVTIWGNKIGEPTCNAFRELLENGRLLPENTDVKPYEVDGINYLAWDGNSPY